MIKNQIWEMFLIFKFEIYDKGGENMSYVLKKRISALFLSFLMIFIMAMVTNTTVQAAFLQNRPFGVGYHNGKPGIWINMGDAPSTAQMANELVIKFKGQVVPFVPDSKTGTLGIDIWKPQAQSGTTYTWFIGSAWVSSKGGWSKCSNQNDWSVQRIVW